MLSVFSIGRRTPTLLELFTAFLLFGLVFLCVFLSETFGGFNPPSGRKHVSGGANLLPKFMPISFLACISFLRCSALQQDHTISIMERVQIKPATERLRGVATYPQGDVKQGCYGMTLTDLMNHHYANAVR